jgi:septal ring factor EnvC (AmiA/AmiB activator)
MCEISESESMERRLDWLAAENAELKAHVSQVWERCKALEDITRQARNEYSEAKGEIHRLKARAVERERHLTEGMVCIERLLAEINRLTGRKALELADKAAILAHVKAAGLDAAPSEGVKTLTVSPEQYELGSAVASGFTIQGGPFVRREPYRLVRRLPDGNYLVEDPAASGTADGEGEG